MTTTRTYLPSEVIVFKKTTEAFDGLSNMAVSYTQKRIHNFHFTVNHHAILHIFGAINCCLIIYQSYL